MSVQKNKRRTVWVSDGLWSKIVRAGKRDNRTASGWLRATAAAALEDEVVPRIVRLGGGDGLMGRPRA